MKHLIFHKILITSLCFFGFPVSWCNTTNECDYALTNFDLLEPQDFSNMILEKKLPSNTVRVFKNSKLKVYIVVQKEEGRFEMSQFYENDYLNLTPLIDDMLLSQPSFHIAGTLLNQSLYLSFHTRTDSDVNGQETRALHFSGKLSLSFIIKLFEGKFTEIVSEWGDGDNLKAFNLAIAKGKSPKDAAFETWTGQRAKENGFTVATIVNQHTSLASESNDPVHKYDEVKVIFTRPK